jgi:hypothetical protein
MKKFHLIILLGLCVFDLKAQLNGTLTNGLIAFYPLNGFFRKVGVWDKDLVV